MSVLLVMVVVVAAAGVAHADPAPRGSISAGDVHGCAVSKGTVMCWGDNGDAQLGGRSPKTAPRPIAVKAVKGAAGVASMSFGTCAWTTKGAVWCWGSGGTDDSSDRRGPTRVRGVDDAVEIDADTNIACARRKTGTVACWGYASWGLAKPQPVTEIAGITDAVEIAVAGNAACARTAAGTVMCWERTGTPQAVADASGAISLAGAFQRSVKNRFHALKPGGVVIGWTMPGVGAVSRRVVDKNAARIADGDGTSCVIGTAVSCWSVDTSEPERTIEGTVGATDVTIGGSLSCARTADARVRCWGWRGKLGDGALEVQTRPVAPKISDVVELDSVDHTTCARRRNGTVACWGHAFTQEREVLGTPTDVPGITDAVEVALDYHGCARRSSGVVSCWGTFGHKKQLVDLPALEGVTAIWVLGHATCGTRADGSIACEGNGAAEVVKRIPAGAKRVWSSLDQLCAIDGAGATSCSARSGPLAYGAITDVMFAVDSCIVRASGAVECADSSGTGKLDRVKGLTDAIAIETGPEGVCALRRGGAVVCWSEGARRYGFAGQRTPRPVPGLRGAVELAGGSFFGCVRRADGSVGCWGHHDYLGIGSQSQVSVPVEVAGLVLRSP